jgi:hypothetical protein
MVRTKITAASSPTTSLVDTVDSNNSLSRDRAKVVTLESPVELSTMLLTVVVVPDQLVVVVSVPSLE